MQILILALILFFWYQNLKKKDPDKAKDIENKVSGFMTGFEDAINSIGKPVDNAEKPVDTASRAKKTDAPSVSGYEKSSSEDIIYLNGEPVDLNGKPVKGARRK